MKIHIILASIAVILSVMIAYTLLTTDTTPPQKPMDKTVHTTGHTHIDGFTMYTPAHAKDIQDIFTSYDYTLPTHDSTVPAIAPTHMPTDLSTLPSKHRKKIFIQILLPLVLKANDDIIKTHARIQSYKSAYATHNTLSASQIAHVDALAKTYYVKGDTAEKLQGLERKVRPIPVALALAQGIIESGWGTSRFATEGNSLFGQWTYKKGAGLTPKNRDKGKTHMVSQFDTPYDSTVAYMKNLNRHRAYSKLRHIRYNAMKNNIPITGESLAMGLENYSQLRMEYVKKIQHIIRQNDLERYNTTSLRTP